MSWGSLFCSLVMEKDVGADLGNAYSESLVFFLEQPDEVGTIIIPI